MTIYTYIYIYIVNHRQTISLSHNSSVWLDVQDALSWDRNPPNFVLDLVSYSSVYIYIYIYIGLVGRMFANSPGDMGLIPGRVMPKTF